MINFNINHYIYIQITDEGWRYLRQTVGDEYIKSCITSPGYVRIVEGETWYRLQMHSVFSLFPVVYGKRLYFKPTIIIDTENV